LRVAQNLLRRFWMETREQDALSSDQLSVWAARDSAGASA
jgi:hypothetical protein